MHPSRCIDDVSRDECATRTRLDERRFARAERVGALAREPPSESRRRRAPERSPALLPERFRRRANESRVRGSTTPRPDRVRKNASRLGTRPRSARRRGTPDSVGPRVLGALPPRVRELHRASALSAVCRSDHRDWIRAQGARCGRTIWGSGNIGGRLLKSNSTGRSSARTTDEALHRGPRARATFGALAPRSPRLRLALTDEGDDRGVRAASPSSPRAAFPNAALPLCSRVLHPSSALTSSRADSSRAHSSRSDSIGTDACRVAPTPADRSSRARSAAERRASAIGRDTLDLFAASGGPLARTRDARAHSGSGVVRISPKWERGASRPR